MLKKINIIFFLALISSYSLHAQNIIKPDLNDVIVQKGWKGKFLSAEIVKKDSSAAIMITKTDDDDLMWLEDFEFINGTIEFDAKGKSAPPQSSFIGIAFNVVDEINYDAVYFRPFNFRSPNPFNKAHAVQYISHPDYTWKRLREVHTGIYEKGIEPAPDGDDWFHARIVIKKPEIKVYINDSEEPSLIVNELSNRASGSIGLWCNGFGMIANLKIIREK